MADTPLTPMMQQFRAAKAQNPGMVVLFRNGDFYELFEDDAELGARVLGLTLTRRDKEIPMSGFPQHKLEHYLGVLLRAGHRVAVCEQLEEAGPGKKLIRREVNRIVTPGTVTEDELLDPRRPNHLVALTRSKQGIYGLAWADLSTGSFSAADLAENQLPDELARLAAVECLLPDDLAELLKLALGGNPPKAVTPRPAWTFDPTTALAALKRHFQVATLTGFGFGDDQPCVAAAGALLLYLEETLKASLAHLRRLRPHRPETFLILDEVTRRSLELTRTLRDNLRDGSLLSVIDRTVTPMGARLLHDSLLAPLNSRPAIEARLNAVEELLRDHPLRSSLRELLDATSDLQRLTTRVSTARATPKDLAAVGRTLHLLPKFKAKLAARQSALLGELETKLELCPDIRELLARALTDDPPYSAKEGGIIREGHHAELDELRKLARDGKDWIARYQAQEVTRTGIGSLKIGFTDVMGYYIEVTNANENRVPPDYIHERTLKGAKRYSTPSLKEYEEKVVTAQERSQALEFELFAQLREQVAAQTHRLLQTADVLALLDLLAALAELAASRNYIRPRIVDEPIFSVQEGRHPVLEQTLPPGTFVPNDTLFSPVDGVFWLITGPNMSGKSTFIRQVALLTLLAHVGSFIPAKSATIGTTDRIFTRVGASDELSRGHSTFMVEMTEAANILNNATSRSLVILDEIGRGTSTYDGVSLAWAITEHLHDAVGCRALFATHYHELAQLAASLPRLRNYTVQVRELEKEIVFLHKIAPGSADRSYGIHVARMAGVPESVLHRAEQVLATLECRQELKAPVAEPSASPPKPKRNGKPEPRIVSPPEAEKPRRKKEPAGPSLFGEGEPAPF
jgi:DNA mismatch repair protein MutS